MLNFTSFLSPFSSSSTRRGAIATAGLTALVLPGLILGSVPVQAETIPFSSNSSNNGSEPGSSLLKQSYSTRPIRIPATGDSPSVVFPSAERYYPYDRYDRFDRYGRYPTPDQVIWRDRIDDSTLINPVVIDSSIRDSVLLNPVIIDATPSYRTLIRSTSHPRPGCVSFSSMRAACQ